MRYVYSAIVLLSLTGLTTGTAPAQITPATLSVTNYRLLSTQRLTRTQSEYTYAADLVNTGAAQPALTATAQSVSPGIQIVSGMGNLHFPGVLAGGSAASLNTFVVIVDRLGDDSFSNLKWSFNAPVANAGPDQTVPVGSTATLNGSGTTNPSGIGRLTYSWVFSSRPPGTRAALRDGSTSMPSFDPDVLGDYIITLTADNGAGSDTSSVTISTKSTKPVADAGRDQTVKPGSLVTLSGAASRDVDGNELTYAWTLIEKPSRSSAILNGATSVSPSFTADAEGTYIAQLIVTDVNGSSDPSTVSVTTFNTPPMANAGANQVVSRGATVQLSGAGSTDVDGDALTYKWSLLSVPTGSLATLNSTTVVNPTFVADLDGTYVAQLIVNDSSNDSAPSTVTITTNTVQAPTANAGPAQSLAHGATVTLNGSGTDPQSRPLTYSWSFTARPAGSNSVLSGATTQNPSFTADLPGTYIAQLIVNNGTLNSAPSTVTISSTNTAPVANAGPPQNPSVGSTVVLDGTASRDAENDPLTYKWSLLSVPPQSTAVLLSPDISSPTFIADVAGTYVAQLIVNDGFISSSPATVSITAGVTAALSLSPNPLNLLNSAADLTVTLPTAAGAGGQTVRFAALDSSVISVPGSISIAAGSTSGKVSVIPLALGSTLIIASSQGFQPATVEVNVTTPSIGISLSASVVGIARSVTGTLTLSAPAPPAGINVSILADVGGIVNPIALVHVNGGSSSATFQVTGLGAGTANLTASSAGYTSGAISITVSQAGAIIVQNNAIVGAGQTANLRVTLISPAPAGGVTVSLVSSNTAKMTVSPTIFFSQGATAPDTVAQITGIAFGTATVTASAPGFSGDTQSVQIGVNLSFNPNTLTLSPGTSQPLTLTLSGPAPSGGLVVTLSSDNSAATVPALVTIPGGSSTVPVSVSAVSLGTATITASSSLAGVSAGTATVSVIQGIVITTSTLPVGVVQAAYSATLSASGGTMPYTFTAANLPAGLTLTNNTITGQPGSAGTTTVAITATDATQPTRLTTTVNLSLVVNPALAISTASLPGATVGTAYSATVTATGGTGPYAFTATGLPANLTISSLGVISGSPSTSGTSSVVVTVMDSTNPTRVSATATLSLPVIGPLAVTTTTLSAGTQGVSYSAAVTASGGNSPYSFTATGLPAGLSISTLGQISGVPTAAGPSTVVITVQDSTSPARLSATASLSLTINPPPLSFTTVSLPSGAQGITYSATVAGTGGTQPYSFTGTGLPPGLSIDNAGLISGKPTDVGTSTASITLTDATSPTRMSVTSNFTIRINPPVLAVTTTSLPGGTMGAPYNSTVLATGGTGPYQFSATGLPANLVIASGGQISGTPAGVGTTSVTVTVMDNASPTRATATAVLSLTIAPPPLAITTSSLASATAGAAYNATVSASGGTPGYAFSATGLPSGLSISATGLISGTTSVQGPAAVKVTVTDQSSPTPQTATVNLSLLVNPAALTVATASLSSGVVGTPYNATVTAAGGTPGYTFSATGLPPGLNISGGGAISGTPTASGTTSAVITVTDSASRTASATLSITIAPTLLVITTSTLPDGTKGTAYSSAVTASGGTPPYSFSATGLPAGLLMSAAGVISGNPTVPGTSTVTITATDQSSSRQTATATLSLTIGTPPLSITTASLPGGTVGVNYSFALVSNGGAAPLSYTATGLPAGLTISGTGVISGRPTASGTSSVAVTVMDSSPTRKTAKATLSLIIAPAPLVVNSSILADGLQFTPYTGGVTITGGTGPFNWTLISGTLPFGLSLNFLTGAISGNPSEAATGTPLTFRVTDSGTPTQSLTVSTTLTIMATTINPTLAISGGTVGNGLQFPITVTLSQASGSPVIVTVASSSPSLLTLAGRSTDVGTGSINVQVAPGATSFSLFAQGLQNSGSVTLTASNAAAIYISGTSTVTLAPSGFVIAGANGVGSSMNVNQGSTTTLTVSSAQLSASGNFVQIQQLMGGGTAAVTLSNSNSGAGTLSSSSLNFTGATDSVTLTFRANPTTAATTVISASTPAGFTTPAANANKIPITVQVATIIPSDVTVGKNLETTASVTLQGTAPTDLVVTLTSSDVTKVLLAVLPTDVGSQSITMLIKAGRSGTPDFYVYGVGGSGAATYNASASGFGNANGNVTLTPSGFILSGPFGIGANFFTTVGSPSSSIDVMPAMLDSSGNFVAVQPLAGGQGTTVNLTSLPGSVGTITSSVTIPAGSFDATAQFQPLSSGTATLKAAPPSGFAAATAGTITATVITPRITIDSGSIIGKGLQQAATLFLGAPAPAGGVIVTLSSDVPGALNLSASATSAGAAMIPILVPGGSTSIIYYMQALSDTGTVNVTASATGYASGSGAETLQPSGFVIGGPFGPGYPVTVSVGSSTDVTVSSVILDDFGNMLQTQPVAGGSGISIGLTSSNPAAGSIPPTVAIAPGGAGGVVQFNAAATPGQTVLTVVQPSGFAQPAQNLVKLMTTVQ